MDWKPVESSQIAEVGYEEGAEYPLGIRFTPTKKQAAAGLPGSVYVYANVTPELYAGLAQAESVGSYFGQNIKPFPAQFPFKKIEAV